jgi:hypothetical protein
MEKGALKHRHSVRRGNSRYATPSQASAFRRVMRGGSATDSGRGDEPDTDFLGLCFLRLAEVIRSPGLWLIHSTSTIVCPFTRIRSKDNPRPLKLGDGSIVYHSALTI